jgi:hypothetical protein
MATFGQGRRDHHKALATFGFFTKEDIYVSNVSKMVNFLELGAESHCNRISDHSWLECDGWAFDASNGRRRGVIVMRSTIYRELRGVLDSAA